MSTWKTASLGEIFEIARGGSPRPIQDYLTDDPNGVNWISISDASASSKFITTTKKRIRPEGVSRSRMVKPGDFLLTNSMSFGRPYIMGTNGCIHDGWLVLSSKHDEVDQDYFFQLLSSDFIYAKFSKLAAGATVKNLNIDLVSGVEVTFPPLEEQRRIAAILDQAETLRTQRRTALALLDSLTQSLFLDMFGDPLIESSGKPFYTLGTVCEKISDGTHHSPAIQPNGVPYITAKHLKAYGLDFHADPWFVSMEDHQTIYSRCDPKPNDVLYIKDGATSGLAAINNYDFEFSMLSSLALLRPNKKLISACYLCHWLNNNEVRKKLIGEMAGAAIRRLTLSKIKAFRLPVPPLPLQQTFATRIASIEALKATHRRALAALDALFASLQQRAFAGQL